ncbi:MAG: type II toxin-antitoxin system RelE/ParE family toxin [Candidatus Hydrogenedentes bacterium]|nr:type II toxin-antitoxin system RelE/ParE family toxin [Candidatus Hydrogenedentota bacterium]
MAVTINTAANSLTEFPERGRVGRIPGTCELVVPGTPYIIPYRIKVVQACM